MATNPASPRLGTRGLSSNTIRLGSLVLVVITIVALGAVAVEKHFTLARADGGVDSAFSAEPDELRLMISACDDAWRAMGTVRYGATKAEEGSKTFRRSLYVVKDMKPGDKLDKENLRAIRPGLGLAPKFLDELMGKTVTKAIRRGTPMSWELV